MIGVIIGSRKVGINPDNVATPIAASLGDLITLSLLAGVSSTLYEYKGEETVTWSQEGDEHLTLIYDSVLHSSATSTNKRDILAPDFSLIMKLTQPEKAYPDY